MTNEDDDPKKTRFGGKDGKGKGGKPSVYSRRHVRLAIELRENENKKKVNEHNK